MVRSKAKKTTRSQGAEASDEYDWNVKARLFEATHAERSSVEEGALSLEWDNEDLPEDGESMSETRVSKFGLNHGDLLRFDDYRYSQAYFVHRSPAAKYKLVLNPDEGGSGHLTIPREILQNVTDALGKYSEVMEDCSAMFYLSNSDKFVVEQLGEVPSTWEISVECNLGAREGVFVSQGDTTWETMEWENAKLDDIKSFFSGAAEPNSKLLVKLDLKGDKFAEYKAKHATKTKATAWVAAFAKLPKTWSVEKGASGMGSSHYKTEWRCKGPTTEKADVKQSIEKFFDGFEITVDDQ